MLFADKSRCQSSAPRVTSFENGNKHILNNPSRRTVYQYRVDGDILTSRDGERCDFIVEVEMQPKAIVFVIELKGSDLEKAIRQIEVTINRYNLTKNYIVRPRIVIHKARTQQIRGTVYRRFKDKFPHAVVKELVLEESIS